MDIGDTQKIKHIGKLKHLGTVKGFIMNQNTWLEFQEWFVIMWIMV
jgi:hypothetical protein